MTEKLNCWRCGQPLKDLILPMSRREVCAECGAEQHVCKLCTSYQLGISKCCDEERAEDVSDKESANFCDYFVPNPKAYKPAKQSNKTQAEAELANLFGQKSAPTSAPQDGDSKPQTRVHDALSELEQLFGKGKE